MFIVEQKSVLMSAIQLKYFFCTVSVVAESFSISSSLCQGVVMLLVIVILSEIFTVHMCPFSNCVFYVLSSRIPCKSLPTQLLGIRNSNRH